MRPSCGRRRSAMLSARHQLQPRNDGRFHFAGRRILIEQDAVHAEANAEFFLEWLDVDVTRALLDGLRDGRVDQPDHRRLARHVAQLFEIFATLACPEIVIARVTMRLAEVTVDRVENFLLARKFRNHVQAGK